MGVCETKCSYLFYLGDISISIFEAKKVEFMSVSGGENAMISAPGPQIKQERLRLNKLRPYDSGSETV